MYAYAVRHMKYPQSCKIGSTAISLGWSTRAPCPTSPLSGPTLGESPHGVPEKTLSVQLQTPSSVQPIPFRHMSFGNGWKE